MTSFRTNRGRAVLDDENIYLSSSWKGQFKRYWEGGVPGRLTVAMFASLPLILLLNAAMGGFNAVLSGVLIGAVLGGSILVFYRGVNYYRGFVRDSVIPKEAIKSFEPVEGSQGLTQPRIILTFEKKGVERKRRIIMPSMFFSYGEEEFEEAKEKLREEGFEVVED